MKPIIVTIYAIAVGLMLAFGFLLQWLVYGISEQFGVGFGIGVGLTVLLTYLGTRVERAEKRQEITRPRRY